MSRRTRTTLTGRQRADPTAARLRSPAVATATLLARRGGRQGVQSHLLSAAAAAVGAALLLVLAAFAFGAGHRGARTEWTNPQPATAAAATAVQLRSVMSTAEGTILVVDLAALPGHTVTAVPPGLTAFPLPGQVFVSPALRAAMDRLPASQLADRFGTVTGQIAPAGLGAPDQLLAIVGHAPEAAAVSAASEAALPGGTTRTLISDFRGRARDPLTEADTSAVALAVGLIVVPIVVLAGASGRLGAARREQRLAALRLAGATPRQILTMTGYEALTIGAAGATLGAVAYLASLPLLARFPLGIGDWFASDLWVGVPALLGMIVLVAALTAVSAVTTLRRVLRDPLGVARHASSRRTSVLRAVAAVALLGYVVYTSRGGDLTPAQIAALVVLVYGAFWIAGPWVVKALGRLTVALSRRPPLLLAGRRLIDDPHAAWRAVSGLVLAGLLAGFVSIAQLDIAFTSGDRNQVTVSLAGSNLSTTDAEARAHTLLASAGLPRSTVQLEPTIGASDDDDPGTLSITVPGSVYDVERAVTALSALPTAQRPSTNADLAAQDQAAFSGYAAISVASLFLGFIVALASTVLSSTADVLDRRDVYRLLRRAGAPIRVLTRARVLQTAIPLVVLAGGTTAVGVYAAHKLNTTLGAAADTADMTRLAACVAGGGVAIMLSLLASRRLLVRMTQQEGEQRP